MESRTSQEEVAARGAALARRVRAGELSLASALERLRGPARPFRPRVRFRRPTLRNQARSVIHERPWEGGLLELARGLPPERLPELVELLGPPPSLRAGWRTSQFQDLALAVRLLAESPHTDWSAPPARPRLEALRAALVGLAAFPLPRLECWLLLQFERIPEPIAGPLALSALCALERVDARYDNPLWERLGYEDGLLATKRWCSELVEHAIPVAPSLEDTLIAELFGPGCHPEASPFALKLASRIGSGRTLEGMIVWLRSAEADQLFERWSPGSNPVLRQVFLLLERLGYATEHLRRLNHAVSEQQWRHGFITSYRGTLSTHAWEYGLRTGGSLFDRLAPGGVQLWDHWLTYAPGRS